MSSNPTYKVWKPSAHRWILIGYDGSLYDVTEPRDGGALTVHTSGSLYKGQYEEIDRAVSLYERRAMGADRPQSVTI